MGTSSLLASFLSAERYNSGYSERKVVNELTQRWTLYATIPGKTYHRCNVGMTAIGVNNSFLVGFKASYIAGNSFLVL